MSMHEISLSVIIPCFNDGVFLREAVASVQSVPRDNLEIIVVNDGSTDATTLDALAEIAANGVLVLHQSNKGVGAARNRGIAKARGCYILPLDADNRIRAEYISVGIEVLDRDATIDVVYSDVDFFGERSGSRLVPDFDLRRMLGDNYIDACAVFRKVAWERCGGYDEHMPVQGREDWDLWIRIALSGGRFYHVARPLFEYRVRSGSMASLMTNHEASTAVIRHIQSKRIEMTIGEYTEPQYSLKFAIELVRERPFRTILGLVIRAYFPSLLPALRSPRQPNESQIWSDSDTK